MNTRNELTLPKWPFFLADVIFVAAAAALWFAVESRGPGIGAIVVLLLLLAALLSLLPYLVEVYWNWQLVQSDREEAAEQQQATLKQAHEEFLRTARQFDELLRQDRPAPEPPAPDPRIGEILQELQQLSAGRAAETEKVLGQMEALSNRAAEQTRREWLQPVKELAASLEGLREQLEPSVRQPGNGSRDEVVAAADFSEPVAEAAKEPVAAPAASADPEPAEAMATPPAKPRRTKKPQLREAEDGALFSTTTLVATAFIGASNKLFLRGEGPGLSWDEGVPMRFVEIGKWSWTTTDASGPIRLQVFKNDEEGDRAGVLTLEPGQRLDIRPDFDG